MVFFDNRVPGPFAPLLDAPISDAAGHLIDGSAYQYTAALFGAPGANQPVGSLTMLSNPSSGQSTVGFRTGVAVGYVQVGSEGVRVIPGAAYGSQVTVQIRVWDSRYQSFEAALDSGNPEIQVGASEPLNMRTTGYAIDPDIPWMAGLHGFSLTSLQGFSGGPIVPEPSTVSLFSVLLGFLAIRCIRRRN